MMCFEFIGTVITGCPCMCQRDRVCMRRFYITPHIIWELSFRDPCFFLFLQVGLRPCADSRAFGFAILVKALMLFTAE